MTKGSPRVSVVTGATHGIGHAVVERLSAEGDFVYRLDIEEPETEETTPGDHSEFVSCDVTSEADVDAAMQHIAGRSGKVDVLVNNAGGFPARLDLEEVGLEDWRRTLDLNLTSVFVVSKACLPLLRRSGAPRIVNIGSLSGQTVGWATSAPYAAAKAGVHSLTRVMAAELADEGFTVNCLAPSAVLTERIRRLRDDDELAATAATIPLGRYQTPDEVAAWVAFLASDEAGFMTGQTVSLNGGRFMA